jgi:hypothetical protein
MTNYTLTTFYVKNNTEKPVNFKASVIKYSSMGPFEMTLPFMVLPQDSVLARRANFKNGISPTQWFTNFIIFPLDSVVLNDPKMAENWVKSTDAKGNLIYTFNVAK